MEPRTKVHAEAGRHDITITREFELPLDLLFKAYEDPELLEQWMNTRVVKLENRRHGSWQFETSDAKGNVVVRMNGTIHEFIPEKKIIRTFEMENTPLPVQLEFFDFESTGPETSRLTMHIIFRSVEARDHLLQMPFAQGINLAHHRIQQLFTKPTKP